jgi:hypothetical protein
MKSDFGENVNRKIWNATLLLLGGSLLVISFNNCSGFKKEDVDGADSSSKSIVGGEIHGADACETTLMSLYQRGYQSFLGQEKTCATCHQNGPGKGRFANSNTNIAFDDFMQIGFSKVSSNAISNAHNYPYSGSQNIKVITQLKSEWILGLTEYASCKGEPAPNLGSMDPRDLVTLETSELESGLDLAVDPKKNSVDLVWDINKDLNPFRAGTTLPNAPGGKIQITVSVEKKPTGETYYAFYNPKIYGANVGLHMKGLYIKVNKQLLRYQTTFRYLDKLIRKGTINDASSLLSTGALLSPGVVSANDQISLAFETLEVVEIPDPAPPVPVRITSTLAQMAPANTQLMMEKPMRSNPKFVDITVSLGQASTETIVASLGVQDDTADRTCFKGLTGAARDTTVKDLSAGDCFPQIKALICQGKSPCATTDYQVARARSIVGSSFNRYDWDYRFTNLSLIFTPGQTTQTVRVILSKDIRQEENRLLSLKLLEVSGPAIIDTTKNLAHIAIEKRNNPDVDPRVPTFTELMNPQSGVIGQRCTLCHNSGLLNGEYDISNYELMVDNGVIVPNDVTKSKMILRLNPNMVVNGVLLRQMPFDRGLDELERGLIEKWILNGALNN